MSHPSSLRHGSFRRVVSASFLALAVVVMLSPAASAQDVISAEAAAEVKASFIANLDAMREKFVALAEAFPEDKYSWRPMDGVRSVSEVLMLIATEGYGFAPTALGAEAAKTREEIQELRMLTDKAQVIEQLEHGLRLCEGPARGDRSSHAHRHSGSAGAHGPRGRPRCGRGHARASRPAHRLCAHESDRAAVE